MRAAEDDASRTSPEERSALRTQYRRDGFALVRDVLDAELRTALCAAIDRIQAHPDVLPQALQAELVFERDLPAARRDGIDAQAVGDALFIIGNPTLFEPAFEALLRHPALIRTACDLLGTDRVCAHFMNVTFKHADFGRAIGWHRDYPNRYMCTARAAFLRLMLPLDGMAADMGATAFHAGTHRISDAQARACHDGPPAAPPAGPPRLALCAAGDLVAIHPKVLHGGAMNRSAHPRRNVVLQFGRPGAALVTEAREAITGWLLP